MRLTRFCSRRELERLRAGEEIFNDTDHYRGGKGGSLSRGFCFTPEEPVKAWKWLKGIVTPEVCVVYEIPEKMLTESRGKYAGKVRDTPGGVVIPAMFKKEYCTTVLSLAMARIVRVIPMELIATPEELEVVRWLEKMKKQAGSQR